MPTSEPYAISYTIDLIMSLKPKSILDIGCGFGKYGVMFREYLDIWFERLQKIDWKLRLDAVEVFDKYINPLHKYIYNNIYIGNVTEIKLKKYDLIFMGDIIEHFTLEQGKNLIEKLKAKWILINTPLNGYARQRTPFNNPYEKHRYMWNENDFKFVNWNTKSQHINNTLIGNPISKIRTVLLEKK